MVARDTESGDRQRWNAYLKIVLLKIGVDARRRKLHHTMNNIRCIAELAGKQIAKPALHARPSLSRQCMINRTKNSCIAARHSPFTRLGRHQAFSTSQCLGKKKDKSGKGGDDGKQASSKGDREPTGNDPYDFTTLEADIANVLEKLKNDLSKLRAGGRFNPDVVENLRVQPDKSADQTVKLSDVAQVIPKGRTVQVLVGEKDVSIDCCSQAEQYTGLG